LAAVLDAGAEIAKRKTSDDQKNTFDARSVNEKRGLLN
jgi:hypothetical protein